MSRLADAAKQYLTLRRALGYKLRHETWWLPDFVAFLDARGSSVITTELASTRARLDFLDSIANFSKVRRHSAPARTELDERSESGTTTTPDFAGGG